MLLDVSHIGQIALAVRDVDRAENARPAGAVRMERYFAGNRRNGILRPGIVTYLDGLA